MGIDQLPGRLVELRKQRGLNRKQLSEVLGIPYRTMVNYENGSREPGHDFIVKLANFYGITTDEILLGVKEHTGDPEGRSSGPSSNDRAASCCQTTSSSSAAFQGRREQWSALL